MVSLIVGILHHTHMKSLNNYIIANYKEKFDFSYIFQTKLFTYKTSTFSHGYDEKKRKKQNQVKPDGRSHFRA